MYACAIQRVIGSFETSGLLTAINHRRKNEILLNNISAERIHLAKLASLHVYFFTGPDVKAIFKKFRNPNILAGI